MKELKNFVGEMKNSPEGLSNRVTVGENKISKI